MPAPIKIPQKKLKDGLNLPVLGFGTKRIGSPGRDRRADYRSLENAIAAGLRYFDTWQRYDNAEQVLGEVLSRHRRRDFFISTKVADLKYLGVLRSVRQCLKRLRTDYLDLLTVVHPDPFVPLEHTMRALDRLVDQGLIKHIGVSNFALARFQEAQRYARHKIQVLEFNYSLMRREVEQKGILAYCQQNDVLLVAWEPLLNLPLAENRTLMEKMAAKYHKTPRQIALNWLISQPHVVTTVGMRQNAHLRENLGALGWSLEPSDIEILRQDFQGQRFSSNNKAICKLKFIKYL